MAVDLSTAITTVPGRVKVTLSVTGGNMTRCAYPSGRRVRVTVFPLASTAYVVFDDSIADDAAVTVADHVAVAAGGSLSWVAGAVDSRHPAGTRSAAFGLAGSSSAVVLVLVEEID